MKKQKQTIPAVVLQQINQGQIILKWFLDSQSQILIIQTICIFYIVYESRQKMCSVESFCFFFS